MHGHDAKSSHFQTGTVHNIYMLIYIVLLGPA